MDESENPATNQIDELFVATECKRNDRITKTMIAIKDFMCLCVGSCKSMDLVFQAKAKINEQSWNENQAPRINSRRGN